MKIQVGDWFRITACLYDGNKEPIGPGTFTWEVGDLFICERIDYPIGKVWGRKIPSGAYTCWFEEEFEILTEKEKSLYKLKYASLAD